MVCQRLIINSTKKYMIYERSYPYSIYFNLCGHSYSRLVLNSAPVALPGTPDASAERIFSQWRKTASVFDQCIALLQIRHGLSHYLQSRVKFRPSDDMLRYFIVRGRGRGK